MSNTFVPFNFNPSLTLVKTTGESYTVPSNKFAQIQIFSNAVSTQGTVSLNSTVFYKSSYIWTGNATSSSPGTVSVVIPSDVLAQMWSTDSNDGVASVPSAITSEVNINFAYSNATVSNDANTSVKHSLVGAGYGGVSHNSSNSIWIKSGDVIDISGGSINVVVMEYDIPS